MLHFFKKKSKIAIDIGSYYTKAMDVSSTGKQIDIQKLVIKKTPEGCFDSGNILDQEKLAQFLTQIISEIGSDKTEVISGVTGKGFMTKKIDIPKMEHNLIGEHIPFEAEQYLPYEISDVDLDYEVLKNFKSSDSDQMALLLIAVLRKTVEQYSELFKASHLTCSTLDANAFALANAFEWNQATQDNVLLIDIGAKGTNIVVLSNNQVVFTRNLGVGGEFYTKHLQDSLNVSFEEAESLKIRASSDEEDKIPEEPYSLLKNLNHSFCDEIYFGYEFYLKFFSNYKVTRAFVTGGGSQIPELITRLEEKLTFPVSEMNLFENVNISTDLDIGMKNWEKFSATCIGLALRNVKP